MKYQRFTPSGGKNKGIRKSESVTKTQFLSDEKLNEDGLVIPQSSGYCCTITGFLIKDDTSLTTVRYLLSSLSPITISHPCFPTFRKKLFFNKPLLSRKDYIEGKKTKSDVLI